MLVEQKHVNIDVKILRRLATRAPAGIDTWLWLKQSGASPNLVIAAEHLRWGRGTSPALTCSDLAVVCELLKIPPAELIFGATEEILKDQWGTEEPGAIGSGLEAQLDLVAKEVSVVNTAGKRVFASPVVKISLI